MLDAIVANNCIENGSSLRGLALKSCRSNWIERIVTEYQAGLAENFKAHVFWLTSDPLCPPKLVRAYDDFTVNTTVPDQSWTHLNVFEPSNGTTLWLVDDNTVFNNLPLPENAKFCARLPGKPGLSTSNCIDLLMYGLEIPLP